MGFHFFKQYDFKKSTSLNIYKNNEFFEKTRYINNVKFDGFQRKTSKTLIYALMRRQRCLLIISHQTNITTSLIIMKTTTNTCKNQKFRRKIREESVEAI